MSFIPSAKGVIKIDLSALRHNFQVLDSLWPEGQGGIMPVIKSDAYGHGMETCARELGRMPVWGFGIYECSEARALREMGIRNRLFLLSGLLGDGPGDVLELSLTVGVVKTGELSLLDRAADGNGAKIRVHLKVDTGMGRFGLEPSELLDIVTAMHRWPNLHFQGLYTHMSSADSPDDPVNRMQVDEFRSVLGAVRDAGWEPELVHMANSAALINLPETRFNLARPGIAIYGALCADPEIMTGFRPAMSFASRLVQIRRFMPGSSFSYGHTFTCRRESLIGVVPVGYDNGYPRSLSNKASVLINGERCPIVGNICMRAFLVDVTDAADVREGQEVVLIGRSGSEMIHVCEIAEKAGTISYELLCLLGKLNKRVILEQDSGKPRAFCRRPAGEISNTCLE